MNLEININYPPLRVPLQKLKGIVSVILLILFFFYTPLHAQIVIDGTVTSTKKVPIQGVNVILRQKNQYNILSYFTTDKNGRYQLSAEVQVDSLQITLNSFGHEKVVRIIAAKSQTLNFELNEQAIQLKEVIASAPPITESSDTLSYLVSKFATESDKVIEDVLKKMPGIEVSESGQISYQGKPINKFYIENMDLLKGCYSLATKNISLKDVATVEVYQNHQPIRALSESHPTDQAAINLRLREDAKGVFSLLATVGAGVAPFKPAAFLWDNELISLFFAKKIQNINTYKGNNAGNDVTQEFTSFYSDAEPLAYQGRILSVLTPSPPPISKQRYLFNDTHAASANVLRAFKNDYQLTANVVYYNDRQKKENYSRSTYYLSGDSSLVVEERANSKSMVNNAASTITVEANKEKYFLNNTLNLNAQWIENRGITETIDPVVNQKLKTDFNNVSNKLEIVKNMPDQKYIRIYSFNGYAQTPQNLLITPALYSDILNNGETFETLRQQTVFKDFSSKTHFSYGISKPKFTQSYWGGFEASVQSLNSLLQPLQTNGEPANLSTDSLRNNLFWQMYKIFIQPYYTYKPVKKLKLDLSLPLSYNLLLINDKVPQNKNPKHRVLFNPSFTLLWEINQKWSIKANYSFYSYFGTIQDTYTGYIMRNYRTFNRNDGQLADIRSQACFLRTSYRHVMKAVFAYLDLIYENVHSNMIKEYIYVGILQVQNSLKKSVSANTFGVKGNISKNVYAWRTTFSLTGYYYDIFSKQMIQNMLVDFRFSYHGLQPKIESQISTWSGLSYALLWNGSQMTIQKNISARTNIQSVSNYLKLYFYPIKKLELMAGFEHYYNDAISKNRNKFFVDFGVSYRWKWADFSLSWSNLLNTHQYNTANYIDVNEFINIYEIRPSQILLRVKFKII